jgi:hypothetical protein
LQHRTYRLPAELVLAREKYPISSVFLRQNKGKTLGQSLLTILFTITILQSFAAGSGSGSGVRDRGRG